MSNFLAAEEDLPSLAGRLIPAEPLLGIKPPDIRSQRGPSSKNENGPKKPS